MEGQIVSDILLLILLLIIFITCSCISLSLSLKSFLSSFFTQSVRPDGRTFSQSRPVSIIQGVFSKHTAGSALVKIGATHVLSGVTLQIGQPGATTSRPCGDVLITTEDTALQQWLQRVIVTLPLEQLCLQQGSAAAWRLTITCHIVGQDGNINDAALLAVVAALLHTKLPKTQRNSKDGTWEIIAKSDTTSLIPWACPIPVSFGIYDNGTCLLDPTSQENPLLVGRLSMVIINNEVANISLSGHVGLSQDQLAMTAQVALQRAKELNVILFDCTQV